MYFGDIINTRDIIERIEELEAFDGLITEDREELESLLSVMEEIKDQGGDIDWRGDWYPDILIAEDYFTEYAMDLLKDIGDLPRDIPHYIVIDEDATADNLKVDYAETEIDGTTYLYR